MKKKKKKPEKIILIGRSNLNSIENMISEVQTDNEIGHKEIKTIINEKDKCCNLKESIGMIRSQKSNKERDKLIKDGKDMGIDEIIKQNEKINNNL